MNVSRKAQIIIHLEEGVLSYRAIARLVGVNHSYVIRLANLLKGK